VSWKADIAVVGFLVANAKSMPRFDIQRIESQQ
jgi:hypothetical protein